MKNYIKIKLPEKNINKKKTLFLDLDETLIHSKINQNVFSNENETNGKDNKEWIIYIRPHCIEFLKNISQFYEIFIYTAADKKYAKLVSKYIDPKKQYIDGIISRDQCAITKCGKTIKDLKFITNRDIKDMILVDNLITNFGSSIENGIPILDFHDNFEDDQLMHLEKFLLYAVDFEDVRECIKERFPLQKTFELMFNENNIEKF